MIHFLCPVSYFYRQNIVQEKEFLSYLHLNYVIIPHLSFPPLLAF